LRYANCLCSKNQNAQNYPAGNITLSQNNFLSHKWNNFGENALYITEGCCWGIFTFYFFIFTFSKVRYIFSVIITLVVGAFLLYSCAKWKDPKGYTDPQLTNPYCNDPNAVNYNWGFPGKPDNTLCFYPNQLFAGHWEYYDTVTSLTSGLVLFTDSFLMNVHSISDTLISVFGFCGSLSDSIILTAGPTYIATVDTLIGDSITTEGQRLCRVQDTINGTITRDRIDSPYVLHISLQVTSDTGSTIHSGSAFVRP